MDRAVIALMVMLCAAAARACPDCAPGRAARALVLAGDLVPNALIALAPFLVVGAFSVWVERRADRVE